MLFQCLAMYYFYTWINTVCVTHSVNKKVVLTFAGISSCKQDVVVAVSGENGKDNISRVNWG